MSALGNFFTGIKNFLFGASATEGVKTRVENIVTTAQEANKQEPKGSAPVTRYIPVTDPKTNTTTQYREDYFFKEIKNNNVRHQ